MKQTALKDIAAAIQRHLTRWEKDPVINAPDSHKMRPYFWARAYASGNRVFVKTISYQASDSLTRQQALDYLAWIDAGNVGARWQMREERMR